VHTVYAGQKPAASVRGKAAARPLVADNVQMNDDSYPLSSQKNP
jgi:hypothetical protein